MSSKQVTRAPIHPSQSLIAICTMLCIILIAGCNSSTKVITATATKTPTTLIAASPTALPSQSPSPTVPPTSGDANSFLQQCGFSSQLAPLLSVGSLVISHPILGGLSYPGTQLPDDLPTDKPFQPFSDGSIDHYAANPFLSSRGSGLEFGICNPTSDAITLTAMGMQIDFFIPDTHTPNVEKGCTILFSSIQRQGTGGCGGAIPFSLNIFNGTWPASVSRGTTATVTQTESSLSDPPPGSEPSTSFGNFPVVLKSGATIGITFTMDYPPQAGTYQFGIGIQTATSGMLYSSAATDRIFLAKNAQIWSGSGCLAPTFLNQIPSDGPEKFFLCPDTGS